MLILLTQGGGVQNLGKVADVILECSLICLLPSNASFNTSNTIQIVFLAIVLGNPKMCLQENLVDCADCGGLGLVFPVH